jgi:hypothetical protein
VDRIAKEEGSGAVEAAALLVVGTIAATRSPYRKLRERQNWHSRKELQQASNFPSRVLVELHRLARTGLPAHLRLTRRRPKRRTLKLAKRKIKEMETLLLKEVLQPEVAIAEALTEGARAWLSVQMAAVLVRVEEGHSSFRRPSPRVTVVQIHRTLSKISNVVAVPVGTIGVLPGILKVIGGSRIVIKARISRGPWGSIRLSTKIKALVQVDSNPAIAPGLR